MNQLDIQGKIDYLLSNFKKIDILRKYTFEEFSSNFEHIDTTIHNIQTSIEALLDIGRYIIADLGCKLPQTNAQVIEILEEENLISQEKVVDYIGMVGFRNRVVHEYNSIDVKLLYEILQNETQDLKNFLAELLQIIKDYEGKEEQSKENRFLK